MTNKKEPKWITDYFFKVGRKEWYVFPTIVIYYNKNQFWATGETSPGWGLYFQWLTVTAGVQSQKNKFYGK